MSYYVSPFNFNFVTKQIEVDAGVRKINCMELYDACKEAQASEEGMAYDKLATGSGLNSLGDGLRIGLTVELSAQWQLRFATGNYAVKILNGNLLGGLDDDPIAYSAGVQAVMVQSVAATVVSTSNINALTDAQAAQLALIPALL